MHLVPKGTKNEPNPKQTSNPPVPQSPKEYVKKVMPNPELLDGFNFQVVNQSSNKEAGDLATAGLFLALSVDASPRELFADKSKSNQFLLVITDDVEAAAKKITNQDIHIKSDETFLLPVPQVLFFFR